MNVVQAWEVNVRNLSIEHGITIDAKVKVALLTSILPSDLQDFVFQVADDKLDFESVRDRVMSLAVNRAAAGRPTPMEVDRVWAEEWPEEGAEGHQCWPCEDEEQLEVNYIGEACLRCGGLGHYARECPTPKGKGKGGGGGKGGKGKGKFNGKGGGKGMKGKGKGAAFGGECWHCGEKGHRATDCPKQGGKMEIGCVEGGCKDVALGGIWSIAAVTKLEGDDEGDWTTVKDKKKEARGHINTKTLNTKNADTMNALNTKNTATMNTKNTDTKNTDTKNTDNKNTKAINLKRFTDDKNTKAINLKRLTDREDKPSDRRFVLGDFMKVRPEAPAKARLPQSADETMVRHVCAVQRDPWVPVGSGEIWVDSAAEESVCPRMWGEAYETKMPARKLRFVNASGGEMGHYGEKTATFRAGSQEAVLSLGFQVSDVQKPLAAVWRIAEKGNIVQFGPEEKDNFIQSVATGKKISMVRKAGSYVIEANYVKESPGFARQAQN